MWRSWNKIRPRRLSSLYPSKSTQNLINSVKENIPIACRLVDNYLPEFQCNKRSKSYEENHDQAKSRLFNVKNDWMEAFGLSGIVFLSWHLWFPCFRGRFSSNPAERYAYKSLPSCVQPDYVDKSIKVIVPTVSATKSKSEVNDSEIIRQGCEALEVAHEKVKSSLNNWLGTESMQRKKYKEAVGYYKKAAACGNVAALFNLGICYEMGLGTEQCFKQAAEFYEKAAKLGHATAMYNLGVFHVHGWGGVEANENEAHKLFTAAAKLGQKDAMKALHWNLESESEESEMKSEESISPVQPLINEIIEPKNNDCTDLWLQALSINLNNNISAPVLILKSERMSSVDSGINDLSPPVDLQICS